jgi:glycosyltransferase involved in cell wall biosynthesis
MAALSVVIPTRGRRLAILARALRRLERQRYRHKFEVVVGLDADTRDLDSVLAVLGSRGGRRSSVRHVIAGRPGASAARNAGWRAATAPVIVFMDDDVLASRDLVQVHAETHAAAGGDTLGVLGHTRWTRWPPPTPFMRWLDQGIQFDFRALTAGNEVGWWHFYTANASVSRAMLERVGGFDQERFPFGYEDLDLAARMAASGLRLRYEPGALAEHLHPQTIDDWRVRVARIAASERRFCERHPEARPYFRELFLEARDRAPARGRGARLAWLVPRRTPWLGPRVWASFDLWHRQQLARPFLDAWEQEARQVGSNA